MGRRKKLADVYNDTDSNVLGGILGSSIPNSNQVNFENDSNIENNNIQGDNIEVNIVNNNLNQTNNNLENNEQTINNENNENPEVKPKKKRGRKPRHLSQGQPTVNIVREKKKRGRKPKEKYNFNTEPLDISDQINENENIIVKLPIKTSDLNSTEFMNNLYSYNPDINEPMPYDPNNSDFNLNEKNLINFSEYKKSPTNSNFIKNSESNNKKTTKTTTEDHLENNKHIIDKKDKTPKRQIDLLLHNKYKKEKKLEILAQLSNNSNDNNYVNKTDISCFWCCHDFNNTPWGIPMSYSDNKYNLFGIFCSPQCACGYLFNSEQFKEKKWEYYSLLNLLYKDVYGEFNKIIPAPSKLCLLKFGGKVSIDKYRNEILKTNNAYLIKFPPITSIIPVMEEVNLKKIQLKNNFIPVDKERILKANQELRLKRSKPVNNKNTLDDCINIIK
jgi:hypothetical protein